jgi:hypothetical protein
MFEKALGYYFVFSVYSLNFFSELVKDFEEFFEDVLVPHNGNRLMVLNRKSIASSIPDKELQAWELFLSRISVYREILFSKTHGNAGEETKYSFENEENDYLRQIKNVVRTNKTLNRPVVYLYLGPTKVDAQSNELLLLDVEKMEQKHFLLENKKPKFFFTETRKISKEKTTANFFLQVSKAKNKTVYYHDPHLLHRKQFSVLMQLIQNGISLACREFILYTSDLDLIRQEDTDGKITCTAFQKRALARAKKLISSSFGGFCRNTTYPKTFIKLCQLRTDDRETFYDNRYATITKEHFRDKRFEVPGHLAFVCSQTFLHPYKEKGAECYLNVVTPTDNHDLIFSKTFNIYEICLHGFLRGECSKCR